MNIFYLDHDIQKAAQAHFDKHIVKMPLETAQILCTACRLNNIDAPYKATHKSHPCVEWAAESMENLRWLAKFGQALCEEYTHRYDKIHACEEKVFDWFRDKRPDCWFPRDGWTLPPLAMPNKYKIGHPVEAYRLYYVMEKEDLAEWTNRDSPDWWSKWD